jgi:hypothetical protein
VLEPAYETDQLASRRPLTIYPYCVCTVAVLGLGIVGCFDYTSYALGSLLVRDVFPFPSIWSCYFPSDIFSGRSTDRDEQIFFACVAIFTCTGGKWSMPLSAKYDRVDRLVQLRPLGTPTSPRSLSSISELGLLAGYVATLHMASAV